MLPKNCISHESLALSPNVFRKEEPMLPYLYAIKTRLLVAFAYRFEILTSICLQLLIMFSKYFFWVSAYGDQGMIADTSLSQMIDYSVLSMLLAIFYSISVEGSIKQSIRGGNVAVEFIKPVSVMGMYFAADVAGIIANFFTKFIPIFLIASLCFGVPIPASFPALLLFIAGSLMGFLLQWTIAAIFGLFSFWVIELGPIGTIKSHIINLLAGVLVPLWLFPAWLSEGLKFLPFLYIVQAPVSVYIGKISISEGLFGLAVQAVWVVILFCVMNALKKRAFRNVIVQGG